MARSYKSALPTWSTYTPHVGPLGIQPAANQINVWHNRAERFTPAGIKGELNRAILGIQQQVAGTGSGLHAAQLAQHSPVLGALQGFTQQRAASQRQWAAHQHGTQDVDEIEAPASEEQAPRTAPAQVNPADVQTQEAARGGVDEAGTAALADPNVGRARIRMPNIPRPTLTMPKITWKR